MKSTGLTFYRKIKEILKKIIMSFGTSIDDSKETFTVVTENELTIKKLSEKIQW